MGNLYMNLYMFTSSCPIWSLSPQNPGSPFYHFISERYNTYLRNDIRDRLFHVTQNFAWLCKQRIAPLIIVRFWWLCIPWVGYCCYITTQDKAEVLITILQVQMGLMQKTGCTISQVPCRQWWIQKNQLKFRDGPKHKLIHDVITRWNSTYDMIERVCEQQLPISSVLLQRRDALMH